MKIFVSWSGERSKAVATILSDWIKCVIQASRPWISTRDIDRGALWFAEIGDQLKETSVGIICLTQENKDRPWILFEAGALAKGLSSNRVCTFLIDLKPTDLEDPLAQFNHTFPTRDSIWGLVQTLNGSLGSNALDERILSQIFETYWPQFESKFANALALHTSKEKVEPRSEKNLLGEILENTRFLNARLRNLEARNDEKEDRRIDIDKAKILFSPHKKLRDLVQMHMQQGIPEEAISQLLQQDFPSPMIASEIKRNRVFWGLSEIEDR
jgi:hypothetical protein